MSYNSNIKLERRSDNDLSVSVIIPVCNEAGNLPSLFTRMPKFGTSIELIFIEGHSDDHSNQVLVNEIESHPEWDCRLLNQPGKGKSDAVFFGLDQAGGDILIIFDADLSVDPEVLPQFYETILQGKGDLIIGNRLFYPASEHAMPLMNLIANKLFGWGISWLFRQRIKDSLCGLKALRLSDYRLIKDTQFVNIDQDPFGDFYLLLGAAKLNLQIIELPVRYHKRQYGKSKIRPIIDGFKLLKLVLHVYLHPHKSNAPGS